MALGIECVPHPMLASLTSLTATVVALTGNATIEGDPMDIEDEREIL